MHPLQVFEQASLPAARPSQQDQRAYRLTLNSRAMRVLKLAHVNMLPIIEKQGGFLGETPHPLLAAAIAAAQKPMVILLDLNFKLTCLAAKPGPATPCIELLKLLLLQRQQSLRRMETKQYLEGKRYL